MYILYIKAIYPCICELYCLVLPHLIKENISGIFQNIQKGFVLGADLLG